MVKKILVVIIVCITLVMIKNSFSETEINFERLQERINEVKELRERDNHPFTKCVEDCFEDSEHWYWWKLGKHDSISSLNDCIKDDNCVECVDKCIKEYESKMDREIMNKYLNESRNSCFINSL